MLMFWLIMAFPLLGSFLNGIVLRKASKQVSHLVGSAALVASFICAVIVYLDFLAKGGQTTVINGMDWLDAGGFHAPFHYILDRREHRERWVGAMQRTSVPLRLIDGPVDPISGAHMVERYRQLIPRPDTVMLDGIGHYPQTEAPEQVLAHYLAFRARLAGQVQPAA